MLKLMKYEVIRKLNIWIAFIVSLFILEVVAIYFIRDNEAVSYILGIAIYLFIVAFAAIFVTYDNIKLLSDDLNKKSGYMLFLTPNNGFKIMASKMMVGFVEVLVVTLIIVGFTAINFNVADSFHGITSTEVFMSLKNDSMIFITEYFGLKFWLYSFLTNGLEWFSFIVTIYLAIVLRKTLFSNIKYKGLISFVVFIVLNVAIGIVEQLVFTGVFLANDFGQIVMQSGGETGDPKVIIDFVFSILNVENAINAILIIGGFWACGHLLNKKVDL